MVNLQLFQTRPEATVLHHEHAPAYARSQTFYAKAEVQLAKG